MKMKKLIALSMVFFSSFSFGQTADELAKSKDFIQYINSFWQMSSGLGTKFSTTERQSLSQDLEAKRSETLSQSQQFAYIASIFKFRDVNSFKGFYDSLNIVRAKLKAQYGEIPQDVISAAAAIVINGRVPQCENRWRYALCAAAIVAEGGIMLAACEAGTVTVGTPLCVAAAALYVANGVAGCHDTWCKKQVDS